MPYSEADFPAASTREQPHANALAPPDLLPASPSMGEIWKMIFPQSPTKTTRDHPVTSHVAKPFRRPCAA